MPNIAPTILLADSLTDTVVAAITVIVSVLAILVSLINANGSASKQAFEQLQAVVAVMEKQNEKDRAELKNLKAELSNERRARLRYEKWARILDALLNKHQIDHPSLEAIENDEEENDN